MYKILTLFLWIVALVGLDYGVKKCVVLFVSPSDSIPLFKGFLGGVNFSLENVRNKGVAWGMLSAFPSFIFWSRSLIILGLIGALLAHRYSMSQKISLSAVVSGALGNVLDYFLYGSVVDMFHIKLWNYSFPVFNVADSLIFLGVLSLFIQQCFEKKKLHI